MILRNATIDDFIRINELYEQLDKEHRDHHPERFKEPSIKGRPKAYHEDLIFSNDKQLVVAEVEGELLGFVEGRIMEAEEHELLSDRLWLQINSLVVDEAARSRGIGQALFDRLVEWSQSRGVMSVELKVYTFNESASAFYRKNGFADISKCMGKIL